MKRTHTILPLALSILALGACTRSDAPTASEADSVAPPAPEMADAPVEAEPKKAFKGEPAGGVAATSAPAAPPPARADERARRAPSGAAASDGAFGLGMQAGPVRAGEWDDNANYREFQRYLESVSSLPYSRIDLRHRRFVVVRDASGRAVPGCRVLVSDQRLGAELVTAASGRAILFPHAEGLQGGELRASTRCHGMSASARFDTEGDDAIVDLRLEGERELPATRDIDVAFVLDTTGSMSEEIEAVKATIQRVATTLSNDQLRVRVGLVEYKDTTDEIHTRVFPMTRDLQAFSGSVSAIRASGGGDYPEDASQGLHVAVTRLDWNPRAVARMAFMIGDAPPQLGQHSSADYVRDVKVAVKDGIKIFTVAASGMDDLGQAVWRQVAQYTGGTNLFVLRGGAGPQSTGGGDPKSSCGGTQENYSSGNLDQLITRKIEREIASLDKDPMMIAGLGQDENAKPCDRRVAWQ